MGSYGVRSGDCIRIDKLCLLDAVDSARPRWQVGKRDYPPAICCDPEWYSGIAAATGDAIGHHHVPQFECSIPKWENQKRNKKGGIEVPHVPHKLTPQFHPSKKRDLWYPTWYPNRSCLDQRIPFRSSWPWSQRSHARTTWRSIAGIPRRPRFRLGGCPSACRCESWLVWVFYGGSKGDFMLI